MSYRDYSQSFGIGLVCLGALWASLATIQADAQEEGTRFVQDRFAIGFWVDPPLDEKAEARYKEIADAHFTMVIGGFGGGDPALLAKQLDLCAQNDLKAIIHARGFDAESLPDHPVCWGYGIRDEPSAADFPGLREKVDAIRQVRPGKLGYINLFPNYANERQLGTPTYEEHVAQFCDVVGPDVLSMDHYPIFHPGRDGRDAYCENLDVMRRHSLARGIPFWNFFNAMPYGPHTDPTEAQMRWQIFTSLAYGAKGVMYFCYYTPSGGEFPKGGALITRDDRRTRHWYEARRINERIKNLGPVLMQLTSTAVYRVRPGDKPAEVLAGSPIADLIREAHDPEFDMLVGAFRHADDRRAVLLTNYHFAYSQWPTVVFDRDAAQVREIDQWTGAETPVVDDSPAMDGLQLSLDAGEGRLFLLPE